jgi:uncharacterized protein
MSPARKSTIVALVAGALFAVGLALGGMTRPSKVLAFLDFGGVWDPSLALVMLGAVATHALGYRAIRGRASPLFAEAFQIPKARDLDWRLIAGASVFGVGWGLAGYCPGPAVASLGAGLLQPLIFVLLMLTGMLLVDKVLGVRAS